MNTPTLDGFEIELTGTFDGHVHLRNLADNAMKCSLEDLLVEFGGAVIEPNTSPELTTTEIGRAYRRDIASFLGTEDHFDYVLMYYLTDQANLKDLERGLDEGVFGGVKYYPANGSTNSSKAVTDLTKIYPVLEMLQRKSVNERRNIPFCQHGERVGRYIDPFDAERYYMAEEFLSLRKEFPDLPMVAEHITTKEAVAVVTEDAGPTWATITPQHALANRSIIFQSGDERRGTFKRGCRPQHVCWPLLKPEEDRLAIVRAIASGNERFGLGTDRAWHLWSSAKLQDHGCGGCYPYRHALAFYAEVFEEIGSFRHFQRFACQNIPVGVYGLPINTRTVKLMKNRPTALFMPELVHGGVKPLFAGEPIGWELTTLHY